MILLVTGGAGYIGTHVVRALLRDGHRVAVIDDLSTGNPDLLPAEAPLQVGSVLDTDFLAGVMLEYGTQGVVHLAGRKAVDESIAQPLLYYRQNVLGVHSLLTAMVRVGVPRIVFSSSAAVYGTPSTGLVTEESRTVPETPYGWSKLMCERMIRDTARAERLSWSALRYFNVAGAAEPRLADRGIHNLIPRVLRAVSSGTRPQIYGDTYPTPDGTCIRDYIHVADLAAAHAVVVRRMCTTDVAATYNVGTGCGASVVQIMHAVRRATGVDFEWEFTAARPGDPARVVADARLIRASLGWCPIHDLDDIVRSAWAGWSATATVGRS
ncbi:UDP-glucose 4-epimerase GalE [Rhodococcus spelaei]|uniref:UDP-glucose 4-epimerase n=1 Tax=Rhodococcus spelaei TaxID=2546320 RepID=A0A541BNQ8_9NOCA|nr:UDP-glucose 4-epimerase GalE [Rhodococcus spelaei]TQF73952.1 UDP-glucose 4-epimerase GalE [Rhodococcus spelaei]